MSARALLRSLGAFALAAAGVALAAARPEPPGELTVRDGALFFGGQLDPDRYAEHPARFHGHHAITYRGGGMAEKALIVTGVSDRRIAAALAALGLDAQEGLPERAWSAKDDPTAPEPDMRARGARLEVSVRWAGVAWTPLEDLLRDQGAAARLDLRFADNRRWIALYGSGCVVCLASCPGSKIANHGYTIRENDQGPMDFTPAANLPTARPVELRIRPALR